MELDKRILSLRTEKGYTQERLAGMLGVSTAAVSKWECSSAYPDITLLPKIAGVFNVSVDYLLGYDLTSNKTISEIVSEANKLRKELKGDEAERLIKQTLARYPDNLQLTFELARHRFINARNKKKSERSKLLSEAAEGFCYVADHDDNKARRDWSLNYLTTISMIQNEYDKAAEYNNRLLITKGLYPRATSAVILLNKSHDEKALQALKDGVYGCLVELTMLLPWITEYYLEAGDYDSIVKENLRAVRVYEEFTDCGWIYNELSCCYEILAFAYANKKEYEKCLDYLEKACDGALIYDSLDNSLIYKVCDDPNDIYIEEKHRASRSMYMALTSLEREIYSPVHETERYKAILSKLQKEIS